MEDEDMISKAMGYANTTLGRGIVGDKVAFDRVTDSQGIKGKTARVSSIVVEQRGTGDLYGTTGKRRWDNRADVR
jgi:hypothetical protein